MNEYYSDPPVRKRMMEFLGAPEVASVTCEYLTAGDRNDSHYRDPQPVEMLESFWAGEKDISRSLWDRESLLVDLDVEYVNFDHPVKEHDPLERIFGLQRPVAEVTQSILKDYGIIPLHLLSGRGHHFVWRIEQDSEAFEVLATLPCGIVTRELTEWRSHPPYGRQVPRKLSRAYAGLELVMEYLADRIEQEAAPMCRIPIQLTAVEVLPGPEGREAISIDISEYGDPLSSRVIRVPFSHYYKSWQQRWMIGDRAVKRLEPIFLTPVPDGKIERAVEIMRNMDAMKQWARECSCFIPEFDAPMAELVEAYRRSTSRRFHEWYYSQEPQPPERWPETYDRLAMQLVPGCAVAILDKPNDLLLKPGCIQRIVQVMLSLGWHPRHIAGLIRSKFERDHGWGGAWIGYDPASRADFYTRLFAGRVENGRDDLREMDCNWYKLERRCQTPERWCDLKPYKESLINRRQYERLACRPFNGLFLPEEHL